MERSLERGTHVSNSRLSPLQPLSEEGTTEMPWPVTTLGSFTLLQGSDRLLFVGGQKYVCETRLHDPHCGYLLLVLSGCSDICGIVPCCNLVVSSA
jgi:hypothetical protein